MTRAALPREAALQAPPGPFTRWFGQGRVGLFSLSRDTLARRYALPASRWVQVMGALVHYTEEGVPEGEPLVLIHGFGASLHTWEGVMPALRQHYRVIRLDLAPFGLTGPLRDSHGRIVTMDIDAYRAFIDAFLAAVNIARDARRQLAGWTDRVGSCRAPADGRQPARADRCGGISDEAADLHRPVPSRGGALVRAVAVAGMDHPRRHARRIR